MKMYKDLHKIYFDKLKIMNTDLQTTNQKSDTEKTNWVEQDEIFKKQMI